MKLLLTSGGVVNPSIHAALERMLGKPVSEAKALAVPTAVYGHPWCDPGSAYRFLTGGPAEGMVGLGWASVGVLELSALPSLAPERWQSWVREADVLLVDGGDAGYLAHWLRESGLADLLPSLTDTVWVGMSAGSMVLTPRIGREFTSWRAPGGAGQGADDSAGDGEGDSARDDDADRTLGVVDFSIFPHLDHPDMPSNTIEAADRWVARIGGPAYAIDDSTAITVVDGVVEVISEGTWAALPR